MLADTAVWVEHAAAGYVFTDPQTVSPLVLRFDTLRAEAYRASRPSPASHRAAAVPQPSWPTARAAAGSMTDFPNCGGPVRRAPRDWSTGAAAGRSAPTTRNLSQAQQIASAAPPTGTAPRTGPPVPAPGGYLQMEERSTNGEPPPR
jgi:hypothetical protein